MKKIIILSAVAAFLGLSSCQKEGYQQITSKWNTTVVNILSDLDNGTTVMAPVSYAISLNQTDWTGNISTSNLVINGSTVTVETDETPYKTDGANLLFRDVAGKATGNLNLSFTDATFYLYSYYYNDLVVGTYSFAPNKQVALAAQYQLGDEYLVRTFPQTSVFKGTTTTSYSTGGTIENYNTNEISYGVYLDVEKSTAAIVMFDAKFSASEKEPKKTAILLEGLTVVPSENGITITGTDIIPQIPEAGNLQPYPSFIINEINFQTTNNLLSQAKISFKVAGIYSGEFYGKYYFDPSTDLNN